MRRGFTPEEREEMRKADAEIEREFKKPRYIRRLRKAMQKEQIRQRRTLVIIRSGRKTARMETWRYWEIVGAMQFDMGADRCTAIDAAKWCIHARPGDTAAFGQISLEVTAE